MGNAQTGTLPVKKITSSEYQARSLDGVEAIVARAEKALARDNGQLEYFAEQLISAAKIIRELGVNPSNALSFRNQFSDELFWRVSSVVNKIGSISLASSFTAVEDSFEKGVLYVFDPNMLPVNSSEYNMNCFATYLNIGKELYSDEFGQVSKKGGILERNILRELESELKIWINGEIQCYRPPSEGEIILAQKYPQACDVTIGDKNLAKVIAKDYIKNNFSFILDCMDAPWNDLLSYKSVTCMNLYSAITQTYNGFDENIDFVEDTKDILLSEECYSREFVDELFAGNIYRARAEWLINNWQETAVGINSATFMFDYPDNEVMLSESEYLVPELIYYLNSGDFTVLHHTIRALETMGYRAASALPNLQMMLDYDLYYYNRYDFNESLNESLDNELRRVIHYINYDVKQMQKFSSENGLKVEE